MHEAFWFGIAERPSIYLMDISVKDFSHEIHGSACIIYNRDLAVDPASTEQANQSLCAPLTYVTWHWNICCNIKYADGHLGAIFLLDSGPFWNK